MKNSFILLILVNLWSVTTHANTVYWTANVDGTIATTSGTVAIRIKSTPKSPNPTSSWTPCQHNFIYFHKKVNGSSVNNDYINRMLTVALASEKTKTPVRLGISRDAQNRCYTSQMYSLPEY